jgi:hypothetical protein
MVLVTALGSLGKHREGDPKGCSMVLVTALGSWGKPARSHNCDSCFDTRLQVTMHGFHDTTRLLLRYY